MNRGRLGFAFLSAIPGIAMLWFLWQLPAAFRGQTYVQKVEWLPQLGFTFDVGVDALSTVMALLVTGVGGARSYCIRRDISQRRPRIWDALRECSWRFPGQCWA